MNPNLDQWRAPAPSGLLLLCLGLMMADGALRAATAAEGGTVNLGVTVIDEKKRDVPNAIVTITYEGGAPIRLQTNDDGFATTSIALPSGISALNVKAEHDQQSGGTTVRVRQEILTGGRRADLACTVALDPPPPTFGSTGTLRLIVKVVDSKGRAVPRASVDILRDEWGPDIRPWETHGDADANGVAVLNVSLAAGNWFEGRLYWPVFRIDATKGDISASVQLKVEGKRVGSETRYPSELTTTIAFQNKDVNVAVLVTDAGGNPIEGADVSTYRSDSARTGADGKANVRAIVYETRQSVEVVKEGYKPGSAPVNILSKDAGNTITATVKLEKAEDKAVELIVHVTSEDTHLPVPDVRIAFTPISGNANPFNLGTNADGNASTRITAYGTFTVRLSQDNYEPLEQQVQIPYGEAQKKLEFKLREKAMGDESVTIAVFAGDVKNGRGGFQPIKGASVTAGKVTGFTDGRGQLTLDAKSGIIETSKGQGYVETVSVKVSASGYLSQSRSVAIQRRGRNMAGSAAGDFILQPGEEPVSDETPLSLVVEVLDRKTKPIEGAYVTFSLPDDTKLFGGKTDAAGKREFSSYHSADQELATLRRGLKVKATHPGYKDHESSVTSDLLKPAKESHYSVQLDKDWSELEKELAALEQEVNAWRGGPKSVAGEVRTAHELGDKCAAARVRADGVLSELKAALKTFDAKSFSNSCKEATDMARAIEALQFEAKQKGERLVAALKEATELAARCKTVAESEAILKKQKEAIKLLGEVGVFGRKAMEINEKLTRLAESMKEAGTRPEQLREQLDKIQKEFETAEKDAMRAGDLFRSAVGTSKSLPGSQARLRNALDDLRAKHKVKENLALIPKEILQRLSNVESLLVSFNDDASFGASPNAKWLEVVKDDVRRIQKARIEASELLSGVKAALCEVKPRNEAVEEIRTRVTDAGSELFLAADLPSTAQACAAKAAASPPPAVVSEEVTVPDLAAFDTLPEMQAAVRHAGLVPGLAATKTTAPAGTKRMFAGQNPAPNTKVKKGSTVTILVYQKAVEASVPTPSPAPVAKVDEVTVPDLSVFDGLTEMQAAASHVGLVPALAATKATAPAGSKRLFAGQNPAAGTKAKKGSTLQILVYQKAVEPDEVTVPDLSVFDGLTEMQAAASHVGLVPALAATKATAPAGSKRLFAGQNPAAGTKAKKGSSLQILVYQKAAEPDEVTVPDLSVFDGLNEMRAAASQVGLVPALAATKGTPPPGSTRLFAGQDPAPGSKAKRGSTLKILVYQKPTDTAASSPSPPATPSDALAGTMPNLIGLTLDRAVARLPANMRIGGDEVGDKPPSEEKAYTIFSQNPPANSKVSSSSSVVVTVKRYGAARVAAVEPAPATESSSGGGNFAGTWQGNLLSIAGSKPTVLEISRSGNGYSVLWYSPNDRKSAGTYPGRVENGRLVFEFDLDLGLTVGAFGSSASEMGAKHILKLKYTFTLSGDTMSGEMWGKDTTNGEEGTRPAGAMKRK